MQFVMPLHEAWTPETIVENIRFLRSRIKWKNFKLTYDGLMYEEKGYFVINLSYEEPGRKSSIHIWRDRVEITSKNWRDILSATVMLSWILRDGQKNIFLDSLLKDFRETGKFNRQYQELCLEVLKSQYLDLVDGKVPKEMLQSVKQSVEMTLRMMLKAVEEIN